jgi:phospholipid/cholesterol/gamma-HCH transport system substrate-binding protein
MSTNTKGLHNELWVGGLFLGVILLLVLFGYLMGGMGSLQSHSKFYVLYNFAGGIEVGSPVRVSGVKVGKVSKIEFLPENSDSQGERVSLKLTIDVSTKAVPSVRQDSRFYVNMAGIIGEKYLEISPGTVSSPILANESTVRGVDPPRIDQLLSQGYGVFGRIMDFMDENEKTLTEFLGGMRDLITDANKLLKGRERQKLVTLIDNLNAVTGDFHEFSMRMKNPETQKFYEQVFDLVDRAHSVDKPVIKKFLQEEGIRARIF